MAHAAIGIQDEGIVGGGVLIAAVAHHYDVVQIWGWVSNDCSIKLDINLFCTIEPPCTTDTFVPDLARQPVLGSGIRVDVDPEPSASG